MPYQVQIETDLRPVAAFLLLSDAIVFAKAVGDAAYIMKDGREWYWTLDASFVEGLDLLN